MKFYRYNDTDYSFFYKIQNNKLNAIYYDNIVIRFFKNGKYHNTKNATLIYYNGYKEFCLNNKYYGYKFNFTKKSWRRFVKMQVFL
jgi:hypothetical protein